jgi:hypothetical protein
MREAAMTKYGDRCVVIKYHGSAYSQSGVSDLLTCLDGVFVAAEVKAPESYGGSVGRALAEGPTRLQQDFMRKVREAGGVADAVATVGQYMDLLAVAEAMATKRWGR